MDLKEYIRSLVQQELEEMSSSGAAGAYMTPNAFAKKGQKTNAATKYAEKEGWKVTKGETTMPSDSKLYDYKTLTGKKKKGVKIYQERSNYDQPSKYGASSGYTAASGYTGPSLATKGGGYYASAIKENMNENTKFKIGDKVTYEKQEWEIEKIFDTQYRLKNLKGLPSTNVLIDKIDRENKKPSMDESLINIIKEELLNEVTYHKFKNEVKFRTKNE